MLFPTLVLVFAFFIAFVSATSSFDVAVQPKFPSNWEEFQLSHQGSMESLFQDYVAAFKKEFASKVDQLAHKETFITRVKSIFDWNSGKVQPKPTWTKGINRFTDLSDDERKNFVMPETKVDASRKARSSIKVGSTEDVMVSKPVKNAGNSQNCDLRPFTTSVKDQGSCGSCWAFGTIAAAEASHFLWSMTDASGNTPPSTYNNAWQLSEQVLMECCNSSYGTYGCGGGGVQGPLQCAVDLGSLPSTISHSYQAVVPTNTTCHYSSSQAAAVMQSWHEPCASGDEACVQQYIGGSDCSSFYAVALKTSIEVVSSFYDYAGGVYSDPNCPSDIHNHAVAIVGWGTDSAGVDYWIIRNSWGPNWGQSGYIYMERGVNMCCVACENLFFQ